MLLSFSLYSRILGGSYSSEKERKREIFLSPVTAPSVPLKHLLGVSYIVALW